MKTNIHCLTYLIQFFLEFEMFQRNSKHTFYIQELSPENCAVYEIMWKNMVQPDKPDHNIIRCIHAAWLDA
jgi:hypothetical protein